MLDLNNDILEIIVDNVKNDNYYRMIQEEHKPWRIKNVDSKVRQIKTEFDIQDRPSVRKHRYQFFGEYGIDSNNEMIEQNLTLKKN